MAMSEVRDAMLGFLPARLVPSVATLSRMETGTTNKIDTIVLYSIARVLGCGLSSLSPEAEAELEAIRELVVQTSPCITARRQPVGAVSR